MNSNLLSKYRTELFGISTIGILIVHSNDVIQAGGTLTELIRKLFAFGGIAVYVFVFLSGIGLYFSISGMSISDRNGVTPKFCVKSIERRNRAKFICRRQRLDRLPPISTT